MAIEHGLFLLDSQMQEIIDIVLEMHNEKPEICTMKTAMQQHIEWLEEQLRECLDEGYSEWNAFYSSIKHAKSLLEKEKEQIVNAYKEGCSDNILDESTDEERAKEYYNETYTNPDRV